MADRPIILRVDEVSSILGGRKTQLRRPVNMRDIGYIGPSGYENDPENWGYFFDGPDHHGYMVLARGLDERYDNGCISIPSPFGVPGDRLWAKECFKARGSLRAAAPEHHFEATVYYRADRSSTSLPVHMENWRLWLDPPRRDPWRPSTQMPRWASRLTLRITDVRVERVRDISEEDAIAEGMRRTENGWTDGTTGYDVLTARHAFGESWSDIYGADTWDRNDWVWACSFEREQAQ